MFSAMVSSCPGGGLEGSVVEAPSAFAGFLLFFSSAMLRRNDVENGEWRGEGRGECLQVDSKDVDRRIAMDEEGGGEHVYI